MNCIAVYKDSARHTRSFILSQWSKRKVWIARRKQWTNVLLLSSYWENNCSISFCNFNSRWGLNECDMLMDTSIRLRARISSFSKYVLHSIWCLIISSFERSFFHNILLILAIFDSLMNFYPYQECNLMILSLYKKSKYFFKLSLVIILDVIIITS